MPTRCNGQMDSKTDKQMDGGDSYILPKLCLRGCLRIKKNHGANNKIPYIHTYTSYLYQKNKETYAN